MKRGANFLALVLAALATPVCAQDAKSDPGFPAPVPQKGSDVAVAGAAPKEENDGTDPTRLTSSADVALEHLDLRGGCGSQTMAFAFTTPIGANSNIRIRIPTVTKDLLGNDGLGFGDISVKLTRVLKVTRQYGLVAGGELVFDTADRPELGSGKTVFKANIVYARFLKGGAIFAPALVHSVSVTGKDIRADINSTTLDLYFVPRLKNKDLFMTLDPAIVHDWESDKTYGSLAVTFGRKLGKMLGGNGQLFVKPSILFGADRSANWGAQIGFKLLNF